MNAAERERLFARRAAARAERAARLAQRRAAKLRPGARPDLDPFEAACPRCSAPFGQPCRTPGGRVLKVAHAARRST